MRNFSKRLKHILFPFQYYVFGDSHSEVFNHLNSVLGKKKFFVSRVDGATALGMLNPNSKTNALPTFMKTISLLPLKSKLVFMLGEVDVGFLLWYRQEQFGINTTDEALKSIENYVSFLLQIKALGFNNITVFSPSPPCVSDNFKNYQKIELRRNIKAGIKIRTELAVFYNNILRERLSEKGVSFIDLYDSLINKSSGTVESRFLHEDKTEHHLNSKVFGQLILDKLLINSRNKV